MSGQTVIVAMPCLNEAQRVLPAIQSLLEDPASARCTFLLLDGGSTDGTREIVRDTFGERVEIIDNPQKLQAHALNMAARIGHERGARYMLRADLHALYPSPFLSTLLDTIAQTGAQSVVVPMQTLGGNAVQSAAALLFASWLGNGGSAHRTGAYRGWVEHGHHALFDLAAFSAAGGYDPDFAANEDAEFDARMTAQGGRVFMENRAIVSYIPRPTLRSTWKQFYRNGRYRVWTAVKHRAPLGKRQLLPIAILPVLALACLLALGLHPVFWLIPLVYAALLLALSFKARDIGPVWPRVPLAAVLAAISHLAFSAGALRSAAEFQLDKSKQAALRARAHDDLRS